MLNNTNDAFDLDALTVTDSKSVTDDAAIKNDATSQTYRRDIIQDTYAQYTKRVWLLDFSDSMNGTLRASRRSKIELLKRLVTQNLDEKIALWGNDILLKICQFHEGVHEFTAANLTALGERIKATYANGWSTLIVDAVDYAVRECEANPSPVGTHQILLVSDGLDEAAEGIDTEYGERCKSKNIVVDVVYITDGFTAGYEAVKASLQRLCEMTGGRFVEVDSEAALNTAFIAGANRLCLPPATAKLSSGQ